jgi:RimJ/RimL family protein N-acetyltransferase
MFARTKVTGNDVRKSRRYDGTEVPHLKRPVMIGDRVYLRPIESNDIDNSWKAWLNQVQNSEFIVAKVPATREDLAQHFWDSRSPVSVMFAVCEKSDDHYVGNVRLGEINFWNRTCNYGRLMGDPGGSDSECEDEALVLALAYAFYNLGMNRVSTLVFTGNEAFIRSNETVGMKREGMVREAFLKEGVYRDAIQFAMLREEYDPIYGSLTGSQ